MNTYSIDFCPCGEMIFFDADGFARYCTKEQTESIEAIDEFDAFFERESACAAFMLRRFVDNAMAGRCIGAKKLFEDCRYDGPLSPKGRRKFKLTNDFTAIATRKIRKTFPDFADCMRMRGSKYDDPVVADHIVPFDLDKLGITVD